MNDSFKYPHPIVSYNNKQAIVVFYNAFYNVFRVCYEHTKGINLHAELSFLALTYNSAKGSALHFVYKIDKTEQTHSTYIWLDI